MATLREIRRQIQSVTNIQKITQAMERVAASRLRRAQAKAEKTRPYTMKLKELLDNLLNKVEKGDAHPLMTARSVQKKGLIVIAGDRGLCGGYNSAIFTAADRLLKNEAPDTWLLFPIGRKTVAHFSSKPWKKEESVVDWGEKMSYAQIEAYTEKLITLFLAHQLDEIWLLYTHFINTTTRKIVKEKLLPIESNHPHPSSAQDYLFEPNAAQILTAILPHYVITKIQSALSESYASELAARIFSMRAATKNAEERLEMLILVRNKVRQAGITRELIEVTSGAESLK